MFFSFGCWLNFSMTLGKTSIVGRKKRRRWNYVLFWVVFEHAKYPNRACWGLYGTDNEKHISKTQTGWRKKKRGGREGDELRWNRSKFPTPPTPFFLLNTAKFTFFPHKSAWTVCFLKNIFHWQSHGCLHSVITGMEAKKNLFEETIPEDRGAGGWLKWWIYFEQQCCIQQPLVYEPKIDSHIMLVFSYGPQWPSHPSL